ncbi:DUF2513 domain-containing protein [Comamonas testosteroni]|uniref:DUF2513 domain-containing protein n=1 Tax=Comamonas testosteroni TaxID=285 RepID=UPI0006809B14|nr:DUF2513 domain-containing protein [Comamonas testosteroni]
MKRDMDLVRRILLQIADNPPGQTLAKLPDVTPAEFGLHVLWLHEAGLVHAMVIDKMTGADSQAFRLTWAGCDFVDAIRDDTLWKKAKVNVLKPGMSFTFDVLKDWLKTEITQGLPTLRNLGQ